MTSLLQNLLYSFGGLLAGFITGQVVAWRRLGTLIVPTARTRDEQRKLDYAIRLAIVVFAITAMVQGVIVQDRQSKCNNEFRRVIADRAVLQQRQTDAIMELQRVLATVEPDADGLKMRQDARREFVDTMVQLEEEKRSDPYPEPKC